MHVPSLDVQEEPVSEDYEKALNSVAITFLQEQQIVPNFYADIIMKAVKRGANWQKQQMMAKAIDAMIEEPEMLLWRVVGELEGLFVAENNLYDGDSVKLIIIKED